MPDLETAYQLAAAKGGTPWARSMAALNDWCVARGSASLSTAQALYDFISAYAGGSVSYTVPGSYSFSVPYFASLTVVVNGAGAGGGGTTGAGGSGGASAFGGVVAYGGGGGDTASWAGGANGAPGGAAGGDSNAAGAGAAGGIGAWDQYSDKSGQYDYFAGVGGAGGQAVKTYGPGGLTPGSSITVVVGGGGPAGSGAGNMRGAAPGNNGSISISWS